MKIINSQRFKPGTRIYYTGDMANCPSEGIITKYRAATKYTYESVDIKFDNERFEGDTKKTRMVPIIGFGTSAGYGMGTSKNRTTGWNSNNCLF